MKDINSQINEFIESQKIQDSILASIFKKIVIEYPNENLRQHAIRASILYFEEKYKDEYESTYNKLIQKRKELSSNEFTANKDNDIRLAFSLPETLLARIHSLFNKLKELGKFSENEPYFMSDKSIELYKEDEWFQKNFPKYTIPQKF